MKASKLPSGTWRCQVYDYTDEQGKRHYKSFTGDTRAKAEYLAACYKRNKDLKEDDSSITVREAINKYIELCTTLSPTTVQAYNKVKRYAFQDIMDLEVNKLTDTIMQQAINQEAKRGTKQTGKTLSPKTVKNEWGLVSAALKSVCNKTYNIRLPKIQRDVEMLPDPAEVFEAIRGSETELPSALALCMGLRLSEIRGLKYSSIDGDYLIINSVVVDVGNVATEKHDAKTAASKRRLKMPPYVIELINNTTDYQTWLKQAKKGGIHDDYLVPMTRNTIYYYFKQSVAEKGINISFHDLRHLYASISLNILNIPAKSVQVSGGWSTMATMNKVYSQSFDKLQEDADTARAEYFEVLLGVHP